MLLHRLAEFKLKDNYYCQKLPKVVGLHIKIEFFTNIKLGVIRKWVQVQIIK